jgi:hypothetical protein
MRRSMFFAASAVLLATFAVTTLTERAARACGGCFTPPENPTVVTDHRMILSIAKEQTTLYDQIRYQGDPGSFAWVLPIAGTVDVGLSADALFNILDQQTQTQIVPPPRNCPGPPSGCNFGAASAGRNAADSEGGVEVLKREVVGPYETVQLKSSDPAALDAWLAKNGFKVPDAIKPVLAKYIGEKFDFLALKLVPGKGVNDMRPVRVTTPGATAVLPLRMVAAGAGATVGITLWVVGEGRYEPQNFPTFSIPTADIVWNWAQSKSNYTELRAQKTAAGGGRAWELESSDGILPQQVSQQLSYVGDVYLPDGGTAPAPGGYTPIQDGQGTVVKTAVQARQEDLAALFKGVTGPAARVTRLRADLAYAALDADLVVTATQDQAVLVRTRQLTREADQPQCPVFDGCESAGTAPRDEAIARSSSGGIFSSSCATTQARDGNHGWLAAGAGFVGLALANAIRRRRAPRLRS